MCSLSIEPDRTARRPSNHPPCLSPSGTFFRATVATRNSPFSGAFVTSSPPSSTTAPLSSRDVTLPPPTLYSNSPSLAAAAGDASSRFGSPPTLSQVRSPLSPAIRHPPQGNSESLKFAPVPPKSVTDTAERLSHDPTSSDAPLAGRKRTVSGGCGGVTTAERKSVAMPTILQDAHPRPITRSSIVSPPSSHYLDRVKPEMDTHAAATTTTAASSNGSVAKRRRSFDQLSEPSIHAMLDGAAVVKPRERRPTQFLKLEPPTDVPAVVHGDHPPPAATETTTGGVYLTSSTPYYVPWFSSTQCLRGKSRSAGRDLHCAPTSQPKDVDCRLTRAIIEGKSVLFCSIHRTTHSSLKLSHQLFINWTILSIQKSSKHNQS